MNKRLHEVADFMLKEFEHLSVERQEAANEEVFTHRYSETYSVTLQIVVKRNPGKWDWHAYISLISGTKHIQVYNMRFSEVAIKEKAQIGQAFRDYIRTPISMAVQNVTHPLVIQFVSYLDQTETREQFLEALSTVWKEEIFMLVEKRQRPRVSIEEYMRPILRIGHRYGLDVQDLDAIEERIKTNIQAAKELTK